MNGARELGGPLVFVRPAGGRLKVTTEAASTIASHLQHEARAPESGGVLLGRFIEGTRDVVVDSVTEPMSEDRRSRARFYRHRRGHQTVLDEAWRASGGTTAWLGEWHTHPQRDPVPSWIDRADWRRKLLVDRYNDGLFFLIAGTGRVRVWEGGRFRPVQPLSYPHDG
jgi:integrative and conjugative element protein (TIGR02256 family)